MQIQERKKEFLNELIELLKIPSVSADSSYDNDTKRCAEWVKSAMDSVGLQNAKIYKTAGHPVVFGEFTKDASLPTVLIYGHYDVQPPDPLELWTSPPFEPVVKDGAI